MTNRHGDFAMRGRNVKSTLYEDALEKADFDVVIRTELPKVEARVTIYGLDVEGIKIDRASAVLSAGQETTITGETVAAVYLGALVHNAHPEWGFTSINLGGAFLFGVIRADSQVLRSGCYALLLDKLSATGRGTLLSGGYVRVQGDIPLIDGGCALRVTAGGEVAAWYFADIDPAGACPRYGGRVRGFIHGTALCIISVRGDLTLEIYRNKQESCQTNLDGQFWIAGGIGFCDPEDWTSWPERWWGDSWCWTCGANVTVRYTNGQWSHNMSADYE